MEKELKISAKITVTYEANMPGMARGSNDFNTLQELKTWLDRHPEIAQKLGYTKRKEQ